MTAWWDFEDSSIARDLTGNQPDGTFSGSAGTASPGRVGAAGAFGGGSVRVNNADLRIGRGDFTVDFWAKGSDTDRRPDVIFDNRPDRNSGFAIYTWRNRIGVQIGGENYTAGLAARLSPQRWKFVTIVVRAEQGTGSIWINGSQTDTFSFTPGRDHDGSRIHLGKRLALGGNEPFTGQLDEFEVFNRALRPKEIQRIYRAGPMGKCKVTVRGMKTLFAELLAERDRITDRELCTCVFEYVLRSYRNDRNRMWAEMQAGSDRFWRLVDRGITVCDPCVPAPSGLIAWYPFDDEEYVDLSGNHAPGTPTGGAATTAGKVDGALLLDGVDDTVDIEGGIQGIGEGSFAVDFWVRTTDSGGSANVIFDNRDAEPTIGFSVFTLGNEVGIQLGGGSPGDVGNHLSGATPVNDGEWHFVVINVNVEAQSVDFYIDGNPYSIIALRGMRIMDSGFARFGDNSGTGANNPFDGEIDEFEIFSRPLTGGEIDALYRADVYGKCKR